MRKTGGRRPGRTDGESDGDPDGRTDGHHHTIKRPVWRRAYKKEELWASPMEQIEKVPRDVRLAWSRKITTSSGKVFISKSKAYARPKWDKQGIQRSERPCRHATPVANVYKSPHTNKKVSFNTKTPQKWLNNDNRPTYDSHRTGVVTQVYGIPIFPLTA